MLLTKDYAIYIRIPKLRIPRLQQILEKSIYSFTVQGNIPKRITRETPQELWAKLFISSENNHMVILYYPNQLNPETITDKTILVNIHELDQLTSYLSIMGFPIDLTRYQKKPIQTQYHDMPF